MSARAQAAQARLPAQLALEPGKPAAPGTVPISQVRNDSGRLCNVIHLLHLLTEFSFNVCRSHYFPACDPL